MLKSKEFIFGFGSALIILSTVFFTAYKISGTETSAAEEVEQPVEMSDDEIIERAKELGLTDMVKEVTVEKKVELTENEVIEKASELGMVFVDPEELISDESSVENELIEPVQSEPEFVTLRIAGGLTAIRIARLLAENGVVDDAKGFQDFLIARRATTSLSAGTLTFPLATDYEEALRVLNKKVVY